MQQPSCYVESRDFSRLRINEETDGIRGFQRSNKHPETLATPRQEGKPPTRQACGTGATRIRDNSSSARYIQLLCDIFGSSVRLLVKVNMAISNQIRSQPLQTIVVKIYS